jgi:FKBP-type peptidyl-prolyl cis-trans isomerase FklB
MTTEFSSLEDKASYAIGQQVGEHLANHPIKEMNFEAVIAGFLDLVNKQPERVSKEDQQRAINDMNEKLQAMQEKAEAANSEKQIAAGEAFLKENAAREEVTVTDSGLQYEVLTAGSGDIPSATSKVRVHYHGTLTDGSVFDSSMDRGEPIDFPVNGVIAGWTEALQLMPVGSRWKLTIPHNLAYGARGAGASIRPFSTLVFEVELLAVV